MDLAETQRETDEQEGFTVGKGGLQVCPAGDHGHREAVGSEGREGSFRCHKDDVLKEGGRRGARPRQELQAEGNRNAFFVLETETAQTE